MAHKKEGELIRLSDIPDNPDDTYSKLLHTFLNFIQKDVSDLKETVKQLTQDNIALENKLENTEKRLILSEGMVAQLKIKVASQEDLLTDIRCRMMQDNLIFKGIDEAINESWDTTKKKAVGFMKDALKMPNIDESVIDRAHRTGEKNDRGPRPIVVKFQKSSVRESVFKYVKNLKGTDLAVQEQFPPEIQERRKRLWPAYKEAKKDPNNKVKWSLDKLLLNGRALTAKDDDQDIDPTNVCDIPIVHTEHKTLNGNVFVGHAAQVTKESEIPSVLASLLRDRVYAGASHTMYAYRVGRTNKIKESCKDDREHGGGSALLNHLRENNTTNTIVIVSRWLGEHLGPRRFSVFKECAQEAVDQLQP